MSSTNQDLGSIKRRVRAHTRLSDGLSVARRQLSELRVRLDDLERRVKAERQDVEALESPSLRNLFHTVLGDKDEQMDKERQEYLAARLQYAEARDGVKTLETEIEAMERSLLELGDPARDYDAWIADRERRIASSSSPQAGELERIDEALADAQSDAREAREAMVAGTDARTGLERMANMLRSAGDWGTWDMLGGGFIATAAKHSKMDQARAQAHQVQSALRRFQRELADVDVSASGLSVDLTSFEVFADYFFDNLITDWIVQDRIRQAQQSVADMRQRVSALVTMLQGEERASAQRVAALRRQRLAIIEQG